METKPCLVFRAGKGTVCFAVIPSLDCCVDKCEGSSSFLQHLKNCNWFGWVHGATSSFICCGQGIVTIHSSPQWWHCKDSLALPWMCPLRSRQEPVCKQKGGKVLQLQLLRMPRNILICVFGSQNINAKSELGQNWYVPFYLLLH